MNSSIELKQAAEALKFGKLVEARQLLDQVITLEPDNADVWQMHFSDLDDPLEKYDCLKQLVRIRPGDLRAR